MYAIAPEKAEQARTLFAQLIDSRPGINELNQAATFLENFPELQDIALRKILEHPEFSNDDSSVRSLLFTAIELNRFLEIWPHVVARKIIISLNVLYDLIQLAIRRSDRDARRVIGRLYLTSPKLSQTDCRWIASHAPELTRDAWEKLLIIPNDEPTAIIDFLNHFSDSKRLEKERELFAVKPEVTSRIIGNLKDKKTARLAAIRAMKGSRISNIDLTDIIGSRTLAFTVEAKRAIKIALRCFPDSCHVLTAVLMSQTATKEQKHFAALRIFRIYPKDPQKKAIQIIAEYVDNEDDAKQAREILANMEKAEEDATPQSKKILVQLIALL